MTTGHPLQLLRRPLGRSSRFLALSALVGLLAGLAAVALSLGLRFGSAAFIGQFTTLGGGEIGLWRWELILLPTLGGILSGFVVQRLFRRPPGHGTDQMVHAFHHQDGHFPLTGPSVKATTAVGVISLGGSAGPEGLIAALGAALGSKVARLLHLTPRNRRTLLIAGCAAAVGALFQCPLGGALFATGILYREPEFEGSALIASFVASIVGYSTFVALLGVSAGVLSGTTELTFRSPAELPVYLVLGVICGATAAGFSRTLRFVEDEFTPRLPMPRWTKPVVGGLLTGVIACALPQVMDGRYLFVQGAFDASLFASIERSWPAWTLLFVAVTVAKCVASAFTVGTGAAGGVLGPCVFVGGTSGAAVGAALESIAPGSVPEEMRQALIAVGMAGVLSAAMRTPLAATVMIMEMTGSFGLIVPLMLVSMTAYLVGGRHGIVTTQVDSPPDSPAHAGDALMHFLERQHVGDAMQSDWALRCAPATPLATVLDAASAARDPHVMVIDGERLVGVINPAALGQVAKSADFGPLVIAADAMAERPFALYPGDTLYEAVHQFQQRQLDAIPVVSEGRREADRFLGVLTRRAVARVVDSHTRETRARVLHEHRGFAALQEQDQIAQIMAGLPSASAGNVSRLAVDESMVGETLASLDFRREHRGEVLAIRTASGEFICPADPQRTLDSGDSLLILKKGGTGPRQDGAPNVPSE